MMNLANVLVAVTFLMSPAMASFGNGGQCNRMEKNRVVLQAGADLRTYWSKDAFWCKKDCMKDAECNAITFDKKSKKCTLKCLEPGYKWAIEDWTVSIVFCDEVVTKSGGGGKCGGIWETCCNGTCESGHVCDTKGSGLGQCAPCGGEAGNDYQMCCPGSQCNGRRVCEASGTCSPCGGMWQPPCKWGRPCDNMLMKDMHGGRQCVMTGTD